MLNKYLGRLESLVAQYREASLGQFRGPEGESATFDDLIWYHIDPNSGRKTRFLCGRHGIKGKGRAGTRLGDALPPPYDGLIKVWIIETSNTGISASEKQARVSYARRLLSVMDGHLFEQTDSSFQMMDFGKGSNHRLPLFLRFCAAQGLMESIELAQLVSRDRTGHARFENVQSKLPNMESVLALGSIFNQVFEHVDIDGSVSPGQSVSFNDAFVITFALLSLASPNRSSAEIPVVPKQKLNSYSENGGPPVHFLNWIGSKGFKDNKNHVLNALAQPVEKAVNFFFKTAEPGRILCRFYENPTQSLAALLKGFPIRSDFKQKLKLTLRANLFTLGYALGFYSPHETIPVLDGAMRYALASESATSRRYVDKPIYALEDDDIISVSIYSNVKDSCLPKLFDYFNLPDNIFPCRECTIQEIQECWVAYFKNVLLPEFPESFSTGESSIQLKDALFCFLGSWFHADSSRGTGSRPLSKASFAVTPLAALGRLAARRLTGYSSGLSIFESYGFSSELNLRPHQLRHLSNTLADMSGIPVEIITAWSGRKDPEQTHTYIHTSHSERADRVSAIINPNRPIDQEIRVVSMNQLSNETNLPASLTSTGLCTQPLNVTPCDYINDFVSHCFLCPESCSIAGDDKAISLFEQDCEYQRLRVQSVVSDPRLSNSRAMQEWYIAHSKNITILSQLVGLMRTQAKGAVIRYSIKYAEFTTCDTKTMKISKVKAVLPDSKAELQKLIQDSSDRSVPVANSQLMSVLSSFGLEDTQE
ncbi:Uncharacterized protein ALO41_03146 [Pseudomonas amygdali pv. ulmi]|uniref:Integrase n=1 Tax=Pseudomonas amygdali pv. ulmi TaxID=251720 RepID=A0A0Q0DQI2_PSEA0|nr:MULTISPECIES: hypothetical protein [Pseudomonas syringae group]KPZ09911.1 Uncharacterized protein ALO41_03146 [Pseudomonas amygdali pv. ulmi]POP71885.1 hypothetical protein CXB35_04085 [Pseudomonas syringae]